MNDSYVITPERKARALLSLQLAELRRDAVIRAEKLAEIGCKVSPTQINGLANALGVGPQRRTPDRRRQELARYLAWRAYRASEKKGAWVGLAEQIKEQISALEVRCADDVEQLRQDEESYWTAHAAALERSRTWLVIETLETFVHALERATGVERDARGGRHVQ
jgi:hypothetical protein